MRRRVERRIRKRLRLAGNRILAGLVADREQRGQTLEVALVEVVKSEPLWHGVAGGLLDVCQPGVGVRLLLARFLGTEDPLEIPDVASGLDELGDTSSLGPICVALNDSNLIRRRWAAYLLGWIHGPRRRPVSSLIAVLLDRSQPAKVRGQAAESLNYLGARRAIPALLLAAQDPEALVRWWAAFALGGHRNRFDQEVVEALTKLLDDEVVPEEEQYSIGLEALGVLGTMDPPGTDFRARLAARCKPIRENPAAWPESDRNWELTWDLWRDA